jgi:hypothetical protein
VFFWAHHAIRSVGGKILDLISGLDHLTASSSNLLNHQVNSINIDRKSIAVYVSYKNLHNDEWEENLFETLKSLGFVIFIIVNTDKIEVTKSFLVRRNSGYDLAAIRDFLNSSHGTPNEFLIVNSSTAWRPNSIDTFLRLREISSMENAPIVSGIESLQKQRHAQSFLFYATSRNFHVLKAVYLEMKNWRSKRATVRYGEIPMLRKIQNNGLKVEFLYPYQYLLELASTHLDLSFQTRFLVNRGIPVNPTQHFWQILISNGAEFVKRNLISKNPSNLSNTPDDLMSVFKPKS